MANNSNPNRTSLAGRVAAETRQAADARQLKMRVASAWTLAKTMAPTASAEQQVKVAENFLNLSTPMLTAMLRQAAVNAHYTRIAEEFKAVHKTDLNDLFDDPSVLSKARSQVESELKGEAKNAAGKTADDRKECGPQPATYDEGKRTEPAGMDASDATQPEKQKIWAEGGEGKLASEKKEAAAKKACGSGCGDDCEHKKEAAAKKAEDGSEGANADGEPTPEGTAPEQEAADAADADASEGTADAAEGDEEGAGEKEEQVFDEEKATLQDAIDDVKDDIDTLQDAINDELGDADEINLGEEASGDSAFDAALEGDVADAAGIDGAEVEGLPPGTEPEELNIENIFSDDNFADKVSALNDEDSEDVFFAPSDAATLEGVLDQEEALQSPADMFAVTDDGNDPLARLFASEGKTAASTEGIVGWGEMQSEFEADHGREDRDADSDHEGDIFGDVLKSIKPEDSEQHFDKQDSTNDLKEPSKAKEASRTMRRAPVKAASRTGKEFPKLATHFDPMLQATKVAGGNLASLIFSDEADFLS